MITTFEVGGVSLDVIRKDIKNVHLSVYPPMGRVRISAPSRMSLDTIRLFAISKLGWIKKQQQKLQEQARESQLEYLGRESHYLWGRRHLLKVIEVDSAPQVAVQHNTLLLQVRPGWNIEKRQALLEDWRRQELRAAAAPLIEAWEPLLGVKVERIFLQRMKTKWGSSSPKSGGIRLNSELARKPRECLEYILVHEMVHLLEPAHNHRFVALMERFMPNWPHYRDLLNRLPVRHERWQY